MYIFCDASVSGFGSSWTEGISVGYRFGVFNEWLYVKISKFREFMNLVETLQEVGRKETFDGRKVFYEGIIWCQRESL